MDYFSGNRIYSEVEEPNGETNVRIINYECFPLEIHVTKKHFILERTGWWFFKKKHLILYRVDCVKSWDLPITSTILKQPVYIPRLLSRLLGEEKQINAVISAYLDIQITRIKNNK